LAFRLCLIHLCLLCFGSFLCCQGCLFISLLSGCLCFGLQPCLFLFRRLLRCLCSGLLFSQPLRLCGSFLFRLCSSLLFSKLPLAVFFQGLQPCFFISLLGFRLHFFHLRVASFLCFLGFRLLLFHLCFLRLCGFLCLQSCLFISFLFGSLGFSFQTCRLFLRSLLCSFVCGCLLRRFLF